MRSNRLLLRQALDRRLEMAGLHSGDTTAWRVCDGAGDGLPGLFIDTFDGHWLVQTKGVAFPPEVVEMKELGWKSVWWKRLDQQEKDGPKFMAGEKVPEFQIKEWGLNYHIDFNAGYSQGIFLDQRQQRGRIREMSGPGKRMLNLFSYTCAFSVAAAAGGAKTESIDLSRPYLDWGKRNFEANGIDTEPHFFCRGDSFDWLRRLGNKGNLYDVVVLDPPTFSRNQQGKLWRVEQDYPDLTAAALKLTAPGGWLLCCTNHHGLSHGAFLSLLKRGAELADRKILRTEKGGRPADFTGDDYLKVVWIQV